MFSVVRHIALSSSVNQSNGESDNLRAWPVFKNASISLPLRK